MWCKHNWVRIETTYAPPNRCISGERLSEYFCEKISFGVTTILWECAKCFTIRKEELLGKQIPPLAKEEQPLHKDDINP